VFDLALLHIGHILQKL